MDETSAEQTEADRLRSRGADTDAEPGQDEVGPVSGGEETHVDEPSAGTEDLSEEERAAIERDRAERLDPDNRPDAAEVDNTHRSFDSAKGLFTDSEGYDDAPERFPSASG